MAEENENASEETEVENYLGDWKDKESAVAGLTNMQQELGRKGNEVGDLRKQNESLASAVEALKAQGVTPPAASQEAAPDLSNELQEVQTKMLGLDPVDANYTANMVALMNQQASLSAQIQHEKTLQVATDRFSEELAKRDAEMTTRDFKKANPEFETPEMQEKIQQYIANDRTGMVDSLVAFREIQRDEIAQQAKGLAEENEKLKNLANLKQGADETGNVFTGSGQSPAKPTKQTMTHEERDAAMLAAVMGAG